MKCITNNKLGFTLAEVLITLGIIGVVAVLTVPNLVSNYQKKVYVAQLQKAYNQISNAVSLLMVDEEVDNLNDSSLYCNSEQQGREECLEITGSFLKKYFKVSQDCGYENIANCVADDYKYLNGDTESSFGNDDKFNGYCVSLNSGMSICIWDGMPLSFYVDVNGKKKPNIWGRDAFYLDVNYQGEIAESFVGYPNHVDITYNQWNDPERCLRCESYSGGCLMKIINDGWKMDY